MKKESANKVILRGCNSGSQPYERQSGRDAEYRYLSMTLLKQGFTLIELLVVVLIIGILAAVALPQYQRAVKKVRYMELLTAAKTLSRAKEMYKLANGVEATDMNALDLTIGEINDEGTRGSVSSKFYCYLSGYCCNHGIDMCHSVDRFGSRCMAGVDNTAANAVCKSLGGIYHEKWGSNKFNAYILP